MSFDPLPAPLREAMVRGPVGLVAELGCGDGRLTRLLAGSRAWVLGLDRAPGSGAGYRTVVGDVLQPPLRRGAWDVVVAGNLLRHVMVGVSWAEVWTPWLDLPSIDGALFILEDEPETGPGPAAHYTRLQALLAGLPGRGDLLPLAEFRRRCRQGPARIAAAGRHPNRYPLDVDAVTKLLAAGAPTPGGEAAALAADIARDGITLGSYWWARVERRTGS